MADARSVVELVFEGVDKTSAATTAALKNVNDFGSSLSGAVAPLADFTAASLKFETALLATGAALTAASVIIAGDFQSAAIDLQKVLSDTEDIEQFKNLAIELSSSYGVAAADVLSSIADFKQAGFTAQEASQLTKSSLDLVIAGGIDAATASEGLVQSLKGYRAEAGEAARIVDLLNSVSNEYGANVYQLLEGFSRLSPIAATANLSLEETVGILTPAIEVFQSGSEAANGMRTVLLRLVDDAKPVQEALDTLKVSQVEANGAYRSARDIFFDVSDAMAGLDKNHQLVIASQLVGVEQATKFLAVLESMPTVLRIAGDGFQYLGSAQKEVEAQFAGFDSTVDRAVQSFANLGIAIGTPLLDESTSIADAIGKVFGALTDSVLNDDQLGSLVSYIEDILEGLSSEIETFARNLPAALDGADLSGFSDNIQGIVDGIASLFSGVDLGSPDGIRRAIESIGGAVGALGEFTGNAIGAFSEIVTLLIDLGTYLGDLDGEWIALAGTVGGFSLLVAPVVTALSSVVTAALAAGPAFAAMSAGIGATVTGLAAVAAPVTAAALGLASIYTSATDIVSALGQIDSANKQIEEFETQYSGQDSRIASRYAEISEQLGYTVTSIGEFEAAVQSGALVFDETTGRWISAINATASSTGDLIGAMDDGTDATAALGTALQSAFGAAGYDIDPLTGAVRALSDGTQEAAESAVKAEDATRGYVIEMVDGIPTFRQFGAAAGGAFSDAQKSAEDAAKASENYLIKMEEIASNERIAVIEAKFALDVAQVEADAQRIQATFESIDNTVNSTGTLIGELFGLAADAGSLREKFALEDQIEQENDRRDAALELQKQLTEAEIRLLRARAQSLERGDAAITVDGAGLQPHLEAFMWEILRAVQVRVNQDGLDMLLGV